MLVLKIEEYKREELTSKGVVICTYIDNDGVEFDGIAGKHEAKYPDFEKVTIAGWQESQ